MSGLTRGAYPDARSPQGRRVAAGTCYIGRVTQINRALALELASRPRVR